jgi:hypothetical protein
LAAANWKVYKEALVSLQDLNKDLVIVIDERKQVFALPRDAKSYVAVTSRPLSRELRDPERILTYIKAN